MPHGGIPVGSPGDYKPSLALLPNGDLSKEPPYAFTTCQRGALGTRATAHRAGAKVHHLKECFGLLVPDPETDLLPEVAAANAEFYNSCGFDALYLDALDGVFRGDRVRRRLEV